jgi:hypothetical protein
MYIIGYYLEEDELTKTVYLSFFTEDLGYKQEHIEAIDALEVGETLDLTEIVAVHTVKHIR